MNGLFNHLHPIFLPPGAVKIDKVDELTVASLKEILFDVAKKVYALKEEEIGEERIREVERTILLRVVDNHWIDHIDAMDDLKQGIGLRAVGQQDPVMAYKMEGFDMFEEMITNIQEETVKAMFHVTIQTETERKAVAKIVNVSGTGDGSTTKKPAKSDKKVGRNDPCPCGSGKKYKKCHGANLED